MCKKNIIKNKSSKSSEKRLKVIDITYIGMFAALMAVCSWICIPFTVPITLQTFGVFLTISLLGGRKGTISILVYILSGAIGLPVFSGFTGGIGRLLSQTGGYIWGFLLSSLVIWSITTIFHKTTITMIIAMIIGLLVCYTSGTLWFMLVYIHSGNHISIVSVMSMCIIPFIIPDIIKITLAVVVTKKLKKHISIIE